VSVIVRVASPPEPLQRFSRRLTNDAAYLDRRAPSQEGVRSRARSDCTFSRREKHNAPFRRPLGSQSVAGLWQVSPNSCSALMRALAQAARSARCNLTFSRLGLVKGPFVLYHETLVVGGAPTRGPAPEYDTRANMDRHIVTHRTPTRHRITSASSTARLGRLQHKPLLTPRLHSFRKVSASSPRARAPAL